MPELPEVETVCRGLNDTILGKKFVEVKTYRENIRIPIPKNLKSVLENKKITKISRRAKYILITLEDNNIIIAHLGMSGKIIVYPNKRNIIEKHDHITLRLDDGKEVAFNDPRRFGLVTLSNDNEINDHKLIANLGIEPLEDIFNDDELFKILNKKNTTIKNAIMDATLIVGVGNIYACESLFLSNIHPETKASSLTKTQCGKLVDNIKKVLLSAIESGGSTLRDYVRSSGDSGYFQHQFKVYGREKELCFTCNTEISRIKQNGRSTFFCSKCQKHS